MVYLLHCNAAANKYAMLGFTIVAMVMKARKQVQQQQKRKRKLNT
jgi:hypothetical protein